MILENATTFLPDAPPRALKAEMATSAQQVEVRIFFMRSRKERKKKILRFSMCC